MDFDKVFTAFRNCISEPKCKDCPWEQCEQFNQKKVSVPVTLALDVLNLLKEHEGLILALGQSNAANEYLNAEVERLTGLLKEQENLLGIQQTADSITFISTGTARQGEERGIVLGQARMHDWLEKELLYRGLLTDAIRAVFHDARRLVK